MREKTTPLTWGLAVGFLAGFVFFVGLPVYMAWKDEHPFRSQMTVSVEQIRKVGEAVAAFERSNQRRPDTLEALVKAGLLTAGDLFDRKRSTVPAIDAITWRFGINPDVLYFPALRKTDPADLVLLCTITTGKRDKPFLSIMNDYRSVELSASELRNALQRTYSYLGGRIGRNFPGPNSR